MNKPLKLWGPALLSSAFVLAYAADQPSSVPAATSAPATTSPSAAPVAACTASDRTLTLLPPKDQTLAGAIELESCHQVIAPDINMVICRLKVVNDKGIKGYSGSFEFTDEAGNTDSTTSSSTTDKPWGANSLQKFSYDASGDANAESLAAAGIILPPMKPKHFVSVRFVLAGYVDSKGKKKGEMPDALPLQIPGLR